MDRKSPFSYKGPLFTAADLPSHARADRLRQDIGELETLRDSVASGQPIVVHAVSSLPGSDKSTLAALIRKLLPPYEPRRTPTWRLLSAGSAVPTTNWPASAATLADEGTPAPLVAGTPTPRPPRTLAESIPPYRPAHQWLRLAGLNLLASLAADEQPNAVAGTTARQQADTLGQRPAPYPDLRVADEFHRLLELCEPQPITLLVHLDRLQRVRDDLLQFIGRVLGVCRFALVRFRAFIRCPNVRSFALVLVATFRHYGHRSEPDGHALPAHRWMSVIGGELVLSR